jgi:uncharacterized protein (DUF983 family)
MVLPGVLTLFGFQRIVVFNPLFLDKLSRAQQWLHLAAMVTLSIAAALVLAPAAYRRSAEPRQLTALRRYHDADDA